MGATAANWILSQPWAMLPETVATIVSIADRTNDVEAVLARRGEPLTNTRAVEVHDGVAVVPVRGPISRYADMFAEISGATSVDSLARDIRTAIDDPDVRGVVLELDTPGGQAAGIGELAAMIREWSRAKPITSYVSNLGASAGLWLASAASRVVISPQGIMGSMGVVWPVSRPTEKDRARTLEFVSSQSPNKRPDVDTDSGRAEMQRVVDAMAQTFIESVASFRKIDPAKIAEAYGLGGLSVGRAAVACGMADAIGSLGSCIADLSKPRKVLPVKVNILKLFTGLMNKGITTHVDSSLIESELAEASADDAPPGDGGTMGASDLENDPEVTKAAATTKAWDRDVEAAISQAELRQELRKARVQLFESQADAFLSLHSRLATPAELVHLRNAYVAAALIDRESPIDGYSVLDGFTASVAARRPAPLGGDLVTGDAKEIAEHLSRKNLKVINSAATTREEAKADADAEYIDRLLAATEEGQAILGERKRPAR